MDRKRRTDTEPLDVTDTPNVQPGRPPGNPPPDNGRLREPRQSGTGRSPRHGEEKARPTDTGRRGA
jgi:hypothetical protein